MKIEKKVDIVKEILLWVYLVLIGIGIISAVISGEKTRNPAEIIYEKSQIS